MTRDFEMTMRELTVQCETRLGPVLDGDLPEVMRRAMSSGFRVQSVERYIGNPTAWTLLLTKVEVIP